MGNILFLNYITFDTIISSQTAKLGLIQRYTNKKSVFMKGVENGKRKHEIVNGDRSS